MRRVTPTDIDAMRVNGYDRSTIAEAEAWLEKCRRADELIELIRKVFANVQLEDGIGLRESDGIDDYLGPAELQRLRATDEKHDWQNIPAELLNHCNAAPSFLDAKGMRFHTPAFIVSELKGEINLDFIERLMDGAYSARDFPELLTNEQRDAIIECFRFYGAIECYSYDQVYAAIVRFRAAK